MRAPLGAETRRSDFHHGLLRTAHSAVGAAHHAHTQPPPWGGGFFPERKCLGRRPLAPWGKFRRPGRSPSSGGRASVLTLDWAGPHLRYSVFDTSRNYYYTLPTPFVGDSHHECAVNSPSILGAQFSRKHSPVEVCRHRVHHLSRPD